MATNPAVVYENQKEIEHLHVEALEEKYDKIRAMCDDLWHSGLESIVITADPQAGEVWSCGSTNGVLFLEDCREIKQKFLKFCFDMTSRPGDELSTVPNSESVVIGSEDDYQDIETEPENDVRETNKPLNSDKSANNVSCLNTGRVQTRSSNKAYKNSTTNRAVKQSIRRDTNRAVKQSIRRDMKEDKGKHGQKETKRKGRNAEKAVVERTDEKNAKSKGNEPVRRQTRKRAKLDPESSDTMHTKEKSDKDSNAEEGIKMKILIGEEDNVEVDSQYTEMKNKLVKENNIGTQNIKTESTDINVKAEIGGQYETFEDFIDCFSETESDLIRKKKGSSDSVKSDNKTENDDFIQHFSCEFCSKKFRTKALVIGHAVAVHSDRQFRCKLCSEVFTGKAAILNHVRTHQSKIQHFPISEDKGQHSSIRKTGNAPRPFSETNCGVCGVETKNREQLREHFKIHNNKRVKCDECEKLFRDKYSLQRHKIVTHSTEKNVKCDQCNKVFKLRDNMILHRKRFHERHFECEICGTKQPTAYTLKKHVEKVHEKKNLIVCDLCGEGFVYPYRFKIHMRRHEGKFPFKCSYCDKRYTSKESLSLHENTHTREREYVCDLCGQKYLQYGHLARHKQLHDKSSRPIKCKFCHMGFRAYSAYRSHVFKEHKEEAIATGSKMILKCEYCPKLFVHPTHLKDHINRHKGEKPYKCETCGKVYADKSNLRQHKYSHEDEFYRCSYCLKVYSERRSYRAHLKTHEDADSGKGGAGKRDKTKVTKVVGKKKNKGDRKIIHVNDADAMQKIVIGYEAFKVGKSGENSMYHFNILDSDSSKQISPSMKGIYPSTTKSVVDSIKAFLDNKPTQNNLAVSTKNDKIVTGNHVSLSSGNNLRQNVGNMVNLQNAGSISNQNAVKIPDIQNTGIIPRNQNQGNIPMIVGSPSESLAPNSLYMNTSQGFVDTPAQDIVNVSVRGSNERPVQGTTNTTLQGIGEPTIEGSGKVYLESAVNRTENIPIQSAVNTIENIPIQSAVNTIVNTPVQSRVNTIVNTPVQSAENIPSLDHANTSVQSVGNTNLQSVVNMHVNTPSQAVSTANTLVNTPLQVSVNTSIQEAVNSLTSNAVYYQAHGIDSIPKQVSLETTIPSDNTEIYIVSVAENDGMQNQEENRMVGDQLGASEYQIQVQETGTGDINDNQSYVLVPQTDGNSTVLVWQNENV